MMLYVEKSSSEIRVNSKMRSHVYEDLTLLGVLLSIRSGVRTSPGSPLQIQRNHYIKSCFERVVRCRSMLHYDAVCSGLLLQNSGDIRGVARPSFDSSSSIEWGDARGIRGAKRRPSAAVIPILPLIQTQINPGLKMALEATRWIAQPKQCGRRSEELAKRFTDTEKWDKQWYQDLSSKMKLFWLYLCDKCDAAGVWSENIKLASYQIGEEVSRDEYENLFGGRMIRLDENNVFLPRFIEFQYVKLKEESKPHAAVMRELRRRGIDPVSLTISKGYPKSIDTLKDKEKDKEKVKEKDQEEERQEVSTTPTVFPTEGPNDTLSWNIRDTAQRYGIESEEFAKAKRLYGSASIERALGGKVSA